MDYSPIILGKVGTVIQQLKMEIMHHEKIFEYYGGKSNFKFITTHNALYSSNLQNVRLPLGILLFLPLFK